MHNFALANNNLTDSDKHLLLHEQMSVSHLGKKISFDEEQEVDTSFGQEREVDTSTIPFSQYLKARTLLELRDLRGAVALRQIVQRGLLAARMNAPSASGGHRQPTPQTAAL